MRLRVTAVLLAAVSLTAITGPAFAQSPADTLTVTRLSDYPTCFHPICFQTGNQYMNFQLLFNSLVKVDPDESTFIPDLADSWEVSPDATIFTFKLNPDATWQDGTPVTADDVIFTAATAAQMAETYATNGTYPIADWLAVKGADAVAGTSDIPEGLVKIDDHTVQFTLAAPNAVWLRNLPDPAYMIMPKHLLEGMDATTLQASDFVNGRGTIGSGPYKLSSFTPDVAVEYAANAAYFKGVPNIPKVIFKLGVDPSTAAAQLQSGELDMAIEMSPGDYDVLKDIDGVDVVNVPGLGVQFLQYPVTNPLVADKRIRQAIYYAFDPGRPSWRRSSRVPASSSGAQPHSTSRIRRSSAMTSIQTRPRSSSRRPSPRAPSTRPSPCGSSTTRRSQVGPRSQPLSRTTSRPLA